MISIRMVKVGTEFYDARRIADLSPRDRLPLLRVGALAAQVEEARLGGTDFADLHPQAAESYRAFIAALCPTVPEVTLAGLDIDGLQRVVGAIIAAERD